MGRTITEALLEALSTLMRPYDVLLVGGNSAISGPIKNLTDSEYSHAMIYLGHGMVLEATIPAGVRQVALNTTASTCSKICILRYIYPINMNRMLRAVPNYLGHKYSYKSLINYITGWFKHRPVDEFTCAGLVKDFYINTGHPLVIPDNPSPEDLKDNTSFTVIAEHML